MKMYNLTNEQLCRLATNGDNRAVEILVNNNIGFITEIAKAVVSEYDLSVNDPKITLDDLLQEGQIAVWKCIDKFDENLGITFLTYVKPAIKNSMIDFIRKSIASSVVETVSLDEITQSSEQRIWSKLIDGAYSKTPEQIILRAEQLQELYAALRKLGDRERTYLLYRFGFEYDREHSVADTAFHFSLSASRAKSVEKEALQKMRELMFL